MTIRTPGTYIGVNINTQRAGLLPNVQRVLFITTDVPLEPQLIPVSTYDKSVADGLFGEDSTAGKMMKAAIDTYRFVNVQSFGTGVTGSPPEA